MLLMVIYSASNCFGRFLGLTWHESTATSSPLPSLRDVGTTVGVSDNGGSEGKDQDQDQGTDEDE